MPGGREPDIQRFPRAAPHPRGCRAAPVLPGRQRDRSAVTRHDEHVESEALTPGPRGGRPARHRIRSRMRLVRGLPPHHRPGNLAPRLRVDRSAVPGVRADRIRVCYGSERRLSRPSRSGPRCHRRRPGCCRTAPDCTNRRIGLRECAVVSTADARTIDRAFQAPDSSALRTPRALRALAPQLSFDVPPVAGQTAVNKAAVDFGPVLPRTACTLRAMRMTTTVPLVAPSV